MSQISPATLKFLKDIKKNNHKAWYEKNKARKEAAYEEMWAFAETLQNEMKKVDQIVEVSPKKMIKRIHRDVRFSKDKTPYKTYIMGGLGRDTAYLRGGYYFKIEPGKSHFGGGFYSPEPKDLKLIRNHIAQEPKRLRKVLSSAKWKNTFGELLGEQVKTSPKGFDKNHPAIDLLRFKQYYGMKLFTEKEVTAPGFYKEVVKTWKNLRPWFDYMSECLTHDLNGTPLV